MLSFNDWPLELNLVPSRYFSYAYFALLLCFGLIFLWAVSMQSLMLCFLPFALVHGFLVYQRDIQLTAGKSITKLSCQNSRWALEDRAELQNPAKYQINFSYLTPMFMVLGFQGEGIGRGRKLIIVKDQLPKAEYKLLYTALKFQRADIFI